MRKLFFLAPLWLGAATAAAQTPAPATAGQPVSLGLARQSFNADTPPEPMAASRTELLQGQLSLSPAQTTRVYAAALARGQGYQAMLRRRQVPGDYGPIQQEQEAIEAAYEAQLKPIFTPAQYQKHLVLLARARKIWAQYQAGAKTGE